MTYRNRFAALAASAAVVALAGACRPDLNITNPNAPDVARAVATPGDVRNLIGNSFNTWYLSMQGNSEPVPGLAVAVMADNMTMSFGNFEPPFNLAHLAASCGASYVARWTALHVRRLTKAIQEATAKKGFRFIEVIAPCATLYARLNKIGTGLELMQFYHDSAVVQNGADTREVDITYQDHIVCGKFVDRERPTFLEMMHAHYGKVLGDRYVPTPPEGSVYHD